jgi:cytochrome b6-f complex iron-sulfur subunit
VTRGGRRVDRWVDDLLHDRRPRGLNRGDAEDEEALAVVIELRSATPGAGMPDPHFVERLWRRVGRETQGEVEQSRHMSRRGLLASGGAVAAAAAVGLVAGPRLTGRSATARDLDPDHAAWIAVADLSDVPPGAAVRFSTSAVEGFVTNHEGTVEALSASCTHLGCILEFNRIETRLDCPCHPASFALDGHVLNRATPESIPSLPRLQSRVRDGRIEVFTA